ncbi:MAG: hypothetical protein RIR86_1125 [Acidobacteriota bacterium]|jgi:hypothetical protein
MKIGEAVAQPSPSLIEIGMVRLYAIPAAT